jgi:hypothetical protein
VSEQGTIILPVLFCGCETLSLTLREVHRLKVFEKGVLRRIFGPKREEVAGGWRRLQNEELRNLKPSSNIIRMIKSRWMRSPGHVARMGKMRNSYKILVRKSEGKKQLVRFRHRWEIRLKWISGKQSGNLWTEFIWLRTGTNGAFLCTWFHKRQGISC